MGLDESNAMNIVENEMWSELKRLAIAESEKEQVLSDHLYDLVTRHSDYPEALAHLLAIHLDGGPIDPDSLHDLIADTITRHSEIATASLYDLKATCERDPACENVLVPFLYYKGFKALQTHRVAHVLWNEGRRHVARFLQSRSSDVYGVDINPGARIGKGIFIDHATGIVIGETAVVEDDVSMLHEVNLGGTGKATGDRHPKIRRGVMIGAGAKILGNIEVGEGSKIAAGSVVLKNVPPHTTVAGVPAKPVGIPSSEVPAFDMRQELE